MAKAKNYYPIITKEKVNNLRVATEPVDTDSVHGSPNGMALITVESREGNTHTVGTTLTADNSNCTSDRAVAHSGQACQEEQQRANP